MRHVVNEQGKPAKKRTGRPPRIPLVDPVIAAEVCDWIAAGGTLLSYCRQPGKPKRSTGKKAVRPNG